MLEIGSKSDSVASVWHVIADTPKEAANLRLRSELMGQITGLIRERAWMQDEAAAHCHVTQSRIRDLLRSRISRSSLEALVNIAVALGQQVQVALELA